MDKNRSFKGDLIRNITISATILMLSTAAIPVAALAVGESQVQEPQVQEPQVQEPQVQEPQVQEPQVQEPQVQEPQAAQAMAPAVAAQANGITIAQVDTADKLKYALTQTTIGEIELTNNIVFTESIAVKNPNVKIFSPAGKRYTIDFATFNITSATAGNKLTLENLTLKNGANGAYATITYDNGSHVTVRDVDFTGAEFIQAAGGVSLGGTVEVNINDASGSDHNSITVYGIGDKGEFVVEDNANVTIRQNTGGAYAGSILLNNATKFVVGTNATLNLIQDGTFTDGKPLIYDVSSIPLEIKSGGVFNVENNISGVLGICGAFTSVTVEQGASFNIKTKNALPLQVITAGATFDIAGEIDFNNRITGTPTAKNAINIGDNSTMKFSGNDVSVWDIANQTENASKSWASIAGLTTFSGLNTKSNDTNNFDFNYDFKAQKYSRISNKAAMEKTTINELNTNSTVVTGSAKPNATIEIKAGNTVLGSGQVGSDGNYSITIAKQIAGTVVTATATWNGQTSTGTAKVNLGQTTIVDPVTSSSATVTGKAEPRAAISVKIGTQTYLGTAGLDGKYSIVITKPVVGEDVTVTAELNGQTSIGTAKVAIGQPTTVDPVTTASTKVTGKAEPGSAVEVKVGDKTYTGTAGPDGNYSVDITKPIAGEVVSVKAMLNGQSSTGIASKIGLGQPTTVEPVTTASTKVTGKAEPGSAVEVKVGDKTYTGTAGPDGNYSVDITKPIVGEAISVKATLNDQTSTILEKVIEEKREITGTITTLATFDPLLNTAVTGTWTGGVAKTALEINGVLLAKNGSANGIFNYYVGVGKIKASDTVYAVAYDKNDNELDRKVLVVNGAVTGSKITALTKFKSMIDSTVTGTWTGNVVKTGLEINGVLLAKNGSANGIFNYYVGMGKINKDSIVYAIAYDKNDQELDRKILSIE